MSNHRDNYVPSVPRHPLPKPGPVSSYARSPRPSVKYDSAPSTGCFCCSDDHLAPGPQTSSPRIRSTQPEKSFQPQPQIEPIEEFQPLETGSIKLQLVPALSTESRDSEKTRRSLKSYKSLKSSKDSGKSHPANQQTNMKQTSAKPEKSSRLFGLFSHKSSKSSQKQQSSASSSSTRPSSTPQKHPRGPENAAASASAPVLASVPAAPPTIPAAVATSPVPAAAIPASQQTETQKPEPAASSVSSSGVSSGSGGTSDNYQFDFDMALTTFQPGQHVSSTGWLLEATPEPLKGRKCLVLDLDETLVHSSFKYLRQADFVIPVDIENQVHSVYVIKRPGVDDFMKRVGELYEVVVFTASVSRYGDPLLDELDIHHAVHHRLFRESCYNYQGNYIKNLSQLGRPLKDIIIIDNSPASYIFHPQHAVPISSWFSDAHDNELLDLLPLLEDLAQDKVEDVGLVLDVTM